MTEQPYREKFNFNPLSRAYGGVIGLRNALFDRGILREKRYTVPVISVGNLSVGGTGKTPVVAHFVSHFLKQGKKVCIVTRGYGGKYSAQAAKVDASGAGSAQLYGDEPVWFARTLGVPVYVGRERSKAVQLCLNQQSPDLIIADDGFQHRWLARDRDIVLLDANEKSPALLPTGRFREPISSLKRADFVFLTKANLATADQVQFWTLLAAEQGFSAQQGNFFLVEYNLGLVVPVGMDRAFPEGESALLASAIARPQSFEHLVSKQTKVVRHFIFPDHHAWKQKDVNEMKKAAVDSGCRTLVVTEKDFVKISDLDFSGLDLYVAALSITLNPAFPYDQLLS